MLETAFCEVVSGAKTKEGGIMKESRRHRRSPPPKISEIEEHRYKCLGIQELSLSPVIWTPHISTGHLTQQCFLPVTRPIEQELF